MSFVTGSYSLLRHLPVGLVLVVGTAVTALLYAIKEETASERDSAVFMELAYDYHQGLERELNLHLEALYSLRDFRLASRSADRESFASFAGASLQRRPAIESLQWIPIVPHEQREAAERAAEADGLEGFTFTELNDRQEIVPASERDRYFPVYFLEPMEEARLLGLDYGTDAARREALERAGRSGELIATEPVRLSPPTGAEKEILLLLRILSPGRSEPHGFVSAVLRMDVLERQARENRIRPLDIALFRSDGEGSQAEGLEQEEVAHSHGFPISLGDQEWQLLVMADRETLGTGSRLDSHLLLGGGLLLTGLIAIWVRQRQEYTRAIEREVAERTAALSRSNQTLQEEIEQRQQAEQSLHRSEERFREAFQHAPVGIGLLSPEGRWTQVNRALCAMTGYSEAELEGGRIADLLHPDHAQQELARLGQILAGGEETFDVEQRFRHKSDRALWVLMSVSQVRDPEQRLLYFVCQILDITDRKRAMEETRQAREFSENIIRSSIDGILAFDRESRFTVWNSGMEKISGISSEEALGKPAGEILPFLAGPEEKRAIERVLSGATVIATDRPFSIPDRNRSGFYEAHYAPLHDNQGGIIGGVAVVRDVTEQKQTQERLQNFTSLLRQRNRELQDFAYVASHDLQEPLRKIRAFGDRLVKRCEGVLDQQGRDYLGRMQDASRRMQVLIEDLLSFSRVSTQASPFSTSDLKQIADAVVADLETRIEQTGARVEVGDLPSIQADPTQMRQLLQNLISNGLKYHRPDTPPRIRVFATEYRREPDLPPLDRHGCLLHVEDNGIGFDEKYLDRIFTVFQRLHGRSEYEGTGVGLAICRKIAERHNGWITARSTPGKGSTFVVAFPYSQNHTPH